MKQFYFLYFPNCNSSGEKYSRFKYEIPDGISWNLGIFYDTASTIDPKMKLLNLEFCLYYYDRDTNNNYYGWPNNIPIDEFTTFIKLKYL